jgi:hypothetical protein
MNRNLALLSVGLALAGTVLCADPIPTLYNTGVDSSGTPLANNTLGDPFYSLVSVPDGSVSALVIRTSAGGYPISPSGPYIGDDSLSTWIGPANDYDMNGPNGTYEYQTTFILSGDPASASIDGQLSSDNEFLNISLNGVLLGISNGDSANFQYWTPFSIDSGSPFASGINTLDFYVNNDGGPTALRVEMTGSQSASVPDSGPGLALEAALFGMMLVAACVGMRRLSANSAEVVNSTTLG